MFFGARGHSKAEPVAALKKSTLGENGDPVQVSFSKSQGPVIWDPKRKRPLENHEVGDRKIVSRFKVDRFSRFRFMCKAALSAGTYVYRDEFRCSFRHDELRAGMNFTMAAVDEFEGFGLRLYDEFSDTDEADAQQLLLDKSFCEETKGSCVFVIPGESSVGFVFGILGHWIGTLNVPAFTVNLPLEGDYDLGHAIQIEQGAMRRLSYRQLAKNALDERLKETKKGSGSFVPRVR